MVKKKGEPTIGLDRMGEPIIDPAPDKPPTWEDSPAGKALFKGGMLGLVAGLAAASYCVPLGYSLGFFDSDLVFFAPALGYIAGALLGWLSVKITGKDRVPQLMPWWK